MDLLDAVSGSRRGDQEAMHLIFKTFYDEIYRVAYLVTRSAQLAEEATQETFVRAFGRLGSLKEPQKFVPWLRAIAGNCAIDALRREKNYMVHFDPSGLADPESNSDGSVFESPEYSWDRAELRESVRRAMAALEPIHRQVLILRFYQDMEVREIAAALDCPVGTVKSRLHRGLKALERQLLRLKVKEAPVQLNRDQLKDDSPGGEEDCLVR